MQTAPLSGLDAAAAVAIDQLIRQVSEGTGGITILSGPNGAGKSRFLDSVQRVATSTGCLVATGCGREWPRPFGLVSDLLTSLWETTSGEILASAEAQEVIVLGPLLPHGAEADTRSPEYTTFDKAALRTFDAFAETVRKLSDDQPIVILIDDLDLAASNDIDAVRHLLHRTIGRPVLVVAALDAEPGSEQMSNDVLRGFPDAYIVECDPRATWDAQRNAIRFYEASTPELRRVLAFAALTGEPFDSRALFAATGIDTQDASQLVTQAHAAGILGADSASLSRRARRELLDGWSVEALAALSLEAGSALAASSAPAGRIAEYFLNASDQGDRQFGQRWALDAAAEAERLGDGRVLLHFLRLAESFDPSGEFTDPHIYARLARAEAEVGSPEHALVAIETYLPALTTQGRPSFVADIARRLRDSGAPRDLWEGLVLREVDAGGTGPTDLAALRILLPPEVEYFDVPDSDYRIGSWHGYPDAIINTLRASRSETQWIQSLWIYPWRTEAETDAILDTALTLREPESRAHALVMCAESYLYRHGAHRKSTQLFEQLVDEAALDGSVVDRGKALVRLALSQFAFGQLDAARMTQHRAKAMVARLGPGRIIQEHPGDTEGDIYPEPSMAANSAWFFEGDWPSIALHWADVARLPERGLVATVEMGMAACAYSRAGDKAGATRLLGQLAYALDRLDPRTWAFNGAVGRGARAVWDMEDVALARRFLGYAEGLLDHGVGNWPTTSNLETAGCMAALVGDFAAAERYFAQALEDLDPDEHRPQKAIIMFNQAKAAALIGDIDKAQTDSATAAAQFTELGMGGWVRRATDLIDNRAQSWGRG